MTTTALQLRKYALNFLPSIVSPAWGLALVLAGLSLPAASADVTLKQLFEVAVDKHPSVLQARSQAQAAGFDVEAARWGRFPTVSSELRSDTNLTQSLAKVEQPVWTGGKLTSRIELSESNLRAAEAGIHEAQFNALSQVATAFFEVLRLEQRIKSATLNVAEHERLVALIQRRSQAEISPPADTTLAQARLQQAVSERIQLKKQLDASLTTLAQWTMPLNGGLKAPSDIPFARLPERLLFERVVANSAQRKRLLSQIESADAQINVSKAQIYPNLMAGYQHTWAGQVSPGTDRNKAYLALQFQSGAGFSARSGMQAAVSRKDAAQQELETLERNLQSQTNAAITELDALTAQIEPAKALLAGTTEVVESYLRQYQVGRKNWLDVLNAQREKTQALYNQADMQYGHQLSKVRLMVLTGDISAQQLSALHD
ncbi:TolC family protein [Limnohabitans sp.]|jgi:adhesin transport system outer membrane protein